MRSNSRLRSLSASEARTQGAIRVIVGLDSPPALRALSASPEDDASRLDQVRQVQDRVLADVIPALRGAAPAASSLSPPRASDDLAALGEATVALAYAAVSNGTPRRLLDYLVDHPDERLDAAALRERLGMDRHDAVARGFAAVAEVFAQQGIARPWSEAQAGYLLPASQAAVLARARGD